MPYFDIIAHRGVPTERPQNTIPSFQRAIELGADAVELDVRLTRDHVPIVYHYFYLDEATALSGPVFNYTFDQLRSVEIRGEGYNPADACRIPSLHEVLDTIGGKIGLEIEIKGPEPESSWIVADVLHCFRHLWGTIEVTSHEPVLLLDIQQRCPGLMTDLLFPRSEDWMKPDVVTYLAVHRARLARARAVHLHPSQLSPEIVSAIRSQGLDVHAWDVNDTQSLSKTVGLGVWRVCTDRLHETLRFRRQLT